MSPVKVSTESAASRGRRIAPAAQFARLQLWTTMRRPRAVEW